MVSPPVSRILSRTTIHLGAPLPMRSCGLPGTRSTGRRRPCLALLLVGFAEPSQSPATLVSSYLTVSPLPVPSRAIGGLLSAALSVGSPRLGVTQHHALWSPDFPRSLDRGRPAGSPHHSTSRIAFDDRPASR